MRANPCASPPWLLLAVLSWLWASLSDPGTAWAAESAEPFRPFSFALLGDPQIGFGPGGEYADAGRFQEVVDTLNAKGPPLVVIPGDLIQDQSFWQRWAFNRVHGTLRARALLAAGNHDVANTRSLAKYRDGYGKDYYDFLQNDCAFVILNSETARDQRISASEFDAQWRFLEATLAKHHAAKRRHIVLVAHRPPFVTAEDEDDSERNWPRDTRTRLLALAKRYGVRWFLAGHLHVNHSAVSADGLNIVVVAGSAWGYDQSPIGYRLFRVEEDKLAHEWVFVAERPAAPFAVPGFREWTPRLFDPSLRHWILTLFYLGAGAAAWRASKWAPPKMKRKRQHGLWQAIALVLVALGLNVQLDVDELLREIGRLSAKVTGIYPIRHLITGAGLVALIAWGGIWLARRWAASPRNRNSTIALALCAVPGAWFALSTISHHDIEMLFDEGWWDLLVTLSLLSIGLCTLLDTNWRKLRANPTGATS